MSKKKNSGASGAREIRTSSSAIVWKPVPIPTDQCFLKQWYQWTHAKVARRFKRDKERIADTVQRVRCRLLQKEFTARWFFKHLSGELVDRTQAERILGGVKIAYVGALDPVSGKRSDPSSLWLVDDLLRFANLDKDRFFYSPQGHTVDSDRMLELLGYPPGSYSALQSMWRQRKVLPAEVTEHECGRRDLVAARPKDCPECERGLALLRARGVTLATDWSDSALVPHLKRMRWNDSQVRPFLRHWRGLNRVFATPQYIMRQAAGNSAPQGIDAGLLAYVQKIVENEVINDFKHLSRTDDMPRMVYNNGLSPEMSDSETVAFDSDSSEEDQMVRIPCDTAAGVAFSDFERRNDVSTLIEGASLSQDELGALQAVDLMEMTVRQYAKASGLPAQRIHRLRSSAFRKLRAARIEPSAVDGVVREVCARHLCSRGELFGPTVFGPCVVARADLFARLYALGMSEEDISSHFNVPRERVAAGLMRAQRQSARPAGLGL